MNKNQLKDVPKAACMMTISDVQLGDNGSDAKTAPIRLKARSGDHIEHWYWGRVVHDLSGMKLSKNRLAVDYAHNDQEVLGYLNKFDIESGDLIASGALTPWREDDRASEVLWKMRSGVPYEASIFFGGNGIKLEEVDEGVSMEVNGRRFDGPGVIIREWPLRGVAICPYGADQNTEASTFAQSETVPVQWASKTEEEEMKDTPETVEAEALAEGQPVEAVAVEAEAKEPEAELKSGESESSLSDSVNEVADQILQLTSARDALSVNVAELKSNIETLTGERDGLTEQLTAVTTERDALAAERDEAKRKLAAIESGRPAASAAPGQEKPVESAWKQAQKSSPIRRA